MIAYSVPCFRFLHAARIGKMKRRKQDEGQVCPLCNRPLAGSEQEMSRHVEHCLSKVEGPSPPTFILPSFPLTLATDCPQICGLWGSSCDLCSFSLSFFALFLCFRSFSPLGLPWKVIGKRARSLTSTLVLLQRSPRAGAHMVYMQGLGLCLPCRPWGAGGDGLDPA